LGLHPNQRSAHSDTHIFPKRFSFSRAPPTKPYTQVTWFDSKRPDSTRAMPMAGTFPVKENTPRGFDTRARDIFSRVQPSRAHTQCAIAHLVEHQSRKLNVAGSNPAHATLALSSLGHAPFSAPNRTSPTRNPLTLEKRVRFPPPPRYGGVVHR
jgi:hypothetical protein